eukprot:Em0016g1177a
MAGDNKQRWAPLAVEYGAYEPLMAGSIDGTDTLPHDHGVVRAMQAKYRPNKQVQGDSKKTLFVARLSHNTTEVTGRSKGYAFVEFKHRRDAESAFLKAHKAFINDVQILVEYECERALAGWTPRRFEPQVVAPSQARVDLQHAYENVPESSLETEDIPFVDVLKVNEQPLPQRLGSRNYNPNRYRLHFEQESKEDVEERKQQARTVPIEPLPETVLEVAVEDIYKPGSVLDLPRRPVWDYHMTKAEVEKNEELAFRQYLKDIYTQHSTEELSFFELNLETWRQLWRVLEISDVLLLITDVRHPVLHFSPALYKYVAEELKKHVVLVLNKIDLVPPEVVVAWRHYFLSKFPELDVICFTSYPKLEEGSQAAKEVRLRSRGHKGKRRSAVGPEELFKVIESLYRDRALHLAQEVEEVIPGVITIGMVGHPNVGKSSIINGIMGKKVLCCMYPIAQVREPFTIVGYLAQRVPLVEILKLKHPAEEYESKEQLEEEEEEAQITAPSTTHVWTAWDICDAWAKQCGYLTAKAARPDSHRAANSILRLATDGKISMYFRPPGFSHEKGH